MDDKTRKAITKRYGQMTYPQLAVAFKELQAQMAAVKAEHTRLQAEFDILSIEIIPDKLAEDGMRSVNLADGGQIKLLSQAYCSTREGAKEQLMEWLKDHDAEEIITDYVHPSTLKAFIKEHLELGEDVPSDEIVNYQPYMRASVVGVKL